MFFSIIVPVFQTPSILKIFLDSLSNTIKFQTQIIFINDGSGNAISELLHQFSLSHSSFCNITIIEHQYSLGCSKSINEALTKVLPTCEAVVFMDSDLILTSQWQERLMNDFKTKPNVGIIGCMLLYPQTGGIQCCGITFQDNVGRHLYLNSRPEKIYLDTFQDVQCTIFAFCAIRYCAIKKAGYLNEDFYNGYEDWDYQMRIKQFGYSAIIDTKIIQHHWEKSNGSHRNFNRKGNIARFWSLHHTDIQNDLNIYIQKGLMHCSEYKHSYILIDLCEARTEANNLYKYLKKEDLLNIIEYIDLSILCKCVSSIWLPEIFDSSFHMQKTSFIFLCDQFVRLLDNDYWWNLRKDYNMNDLIIDLNSNVLKFKELSDIFWPGTKIR